MSQVINRVCGLGRQVGHGVSTVARGGLTAACWSVANVARPFAQGFLFMPAVAGSAAYHVSILCDRRVTTREVAVNLYMNIGSRFQAAVQGTTLKKIVRAAAFAAGVATFGYYCAMPLAFGLFKGAKFAYAAMSAGLPGTIVSGIAGAGVAVAKGLVAGGAFLGGKLLAGGIFVGAKLMVAAYAIGGFGVAVASGLWSVACTVAGGIATGAGMAAGAVATCVSTIFGSKITQFGATFIAGGVINRAIFGRQQLRRQTPPIVNEPLSEELVTACTPSGAAKIEKTD